MNFVIRDCIADPLIGVEPSAIDNRYYKEMRNFIEKNIKEELLSLCEEENTKTNLKRIVDIGLTGHIKDHLLDYKSVIYETIDIDGTNIPTFVCDITKENSDIIEDQRYDMTICTEVLEHTNDPIRAIEELTRITKIGGTLIISTPYNFRIHGPLYDNFRISEWYYKNALKEKFEIVKFVCLEDANRKLAPINYFLVARKK